jgi:hypothetical protein
MTPTAKMPKLRIQSVKNPPANSCVAFLDSTRIQTDRTTFVRTLQEW